MVEHGAGQTLTINNMEFFEARIAIEAPPSELIIFESFIPYLDPCVQEPTTLLGALINAGENQMNNGTLWMLLYP